MAQLSGLTNNEKLRGSKKPEPDDIDVDEIPLPQKRTFYERVYEMAEKFAENSLGQFVIERADRILKVVEDTAKWSLPQEKTENNLERPMSWVPFLMLIVTLRVLRFWLTVGAMMIGNGPVTPANTVYFIQTRRRKLRALRVHGAKAIRRRAAETRMEASNGSAADKSIVDKLRNLLSIAICRPGQQREQAKSVFIKQDSGFVSSNDRQSSKRPRDDSLNDHNLTIDQMLSKYANEDSEDDSDFVPRPEEETNDDSTSASESEEGSDASSDEDSNAEASAKEKTPRKQTSDGVEIVENGTGKRCAMPKPMQEIKKEMHSDADSMNDESTPGKDKENKKQMGNGVEKQQNQQSQPTAKKTTAASAASNTNNNNKTALTNGMSEKQQTAAAKTTANGTDSTGMPKQSLALNTTANAGSPTDFNACFAKLINDDTTNDTTTSTPTSNFETELYDNFPISEQSNLLTEDQQQQPQQPIYAKHQPFYHNQRYRGKNRRY